MDGLERVAVQAIQLLPFFATYVNRPDSQLLGCPWLSQLEQAHHIVHGTFSAEVVRCMTRPPTSTAELDALIEVEP